MQSLRSLFPFAVVAALLAAPVAVAQTVPEVPVASPVARVSQRVGVTDFTVAYSSPAVKGRTIWGGLVPYDQLWRTGANAATTLEASRDFTFAGKPVKAGTYSLFTIPAKSGEWTVILNSNATASASNHDAKLDVARGTVKAAQLPAVRERLTFIFSDTTDDTTNLDLEWERARVRIPLAVDTKAQVAGNIEQTLAEAWRPHFVAARYLLESGGDLNKALEYANTSIAVKPHWWNNWVKAEILAKQGRKKDAVAAAQQAQKLGTGDYVYESFFKPRIAKAIGEWK